MIPSKKDDWSDDNYVAYIMDFSKKHMNDPFRFFATQKVLIKWQKPLNFVPYAHCWPSF